MWESTIQIEQSEVIRGEPGQLWKLLSSPAAWSLRSYAPFMFDVPGAQRLRIYIGRTPRGIGSVLFEISDEVPGQMIRLRTLPTGRQEHTLTVAAGRRGTAKATVQVKELVPRQRKIEYESVRRYDVKRWLSAVRAVIEGRARSPSAEFSAELRKACTARPPIIDPQGASASVLIDADPATVWDAVHSPETVRRFSPPRPIYAGYVPGTPQGDVGEMQYHILRRSDGKLDGDIIAVDEISEPRSALTYVLGGALQVEQSYLLTPGSDTGPTRLDLTCRWSAPKTADVRDAVKSRMSQSLDVWVKEYKALIESAA